MTPSIEHSPPPPFPFHHFPYCSLAILASLFRRLGFPFLLCRCLSPAKLLHSISLSLTNVRITQSGYINSTRLNTKRLPAKNNAVAVAMAMSTASFSKCYALFPILSLACLTMFVNCMRLGIKIRVFAIVCSLSTLMFSSRVACTDFVSDNTGL